MINPFVEIARVIGEPIDPNLRVSDVISKIAQVETAEPGEEVKYYASYDANVDDIYTADANGALTIHKLNNAAATALTFQGLQSKLEYVLINDLMAGSEGNKPDTGVLGRKKAALARAMDKEEIRRICAACVALSGQEVTQGSGEDLYDLIMGLVHKVEDFADDYVLLVGSSVKEAIDNYDKTNADNFNYNVKILDMLKNAGIAEVIKLAGTFTNSSGTGQRMLAVDKLILVGRNSTIAQGRPILFVRRKIGAQTAEAVNLPVGAERIIQPVGNPIITDGTNNLLAYGVVGFESLIEAIVNPYAIAWATYSA